MKSFFIFQIVLVLCLGVFASNALKTASSSIGPRLQENGDEFSLPAKSERLSLLRNPCLDESAQKERPEFCCVEHGVGCTDDIVPKESCLAEKLQLGQVAYCCSKHGFSCPQLGKTCSEILPCGEGTCVFSQLSFTHTGTCESINDDVEKCSVDYCSLYGADAACTVGDLDTDVVTCGAWHRYLTMGGAKICLFPCTKECLPKSLCPVTSDGRTFCTLCQLKSVSCHSEFSVYGPIETDEPEPSTEPEKDAGVDRRYESSTEPEMESSAEPEVEEASPEDFEDFVEETEDPDATCTSSVITPFDVFKCCEKFNIGCRKEGEACSTFGSMVPQTPCEAEHRRPVRFRIVRT